MANICGFSMLVRGNIDDIKRFCDAMSQNGNIYMGRGADVEINLDGYDNCAYIDGWCKWSVQSAMVSNAIDMRNNPTRWAWSDGTDPTKLEFITLFEACQKWNLDMEVYSEEAGCCFQEHYIVVNGDLICDECVDYYEYNLDDYDTKEEAERELKIEITDDEWRVGGYISRGGFEWNFEI